MVRHSRTWSAQAAPPSLIGTKLMPTPPPEPQAVCRPTTRSAIFIVASLSSGADQGDAVRDWCADISALVRSVGRRDPSGNLSCVCGFGADAWDALFGAPRPASLHPFREFET